MREGRHNTRQKKLERTNHHPPHPLFIFRRHEGHSQNITPPRILPRAVESVALGGQRARQPWRGAPQAAALEGLLAA
eukprot:12374274-Alexandrium_andersonii.AAC.1